MILYVVAVVLVYCSAFLPSIESINAGNFIDLTYAVNNETIVTPGRKLSFNVEFEGYTPKGFWVASKGFCISEHTGTHIDAPYHFHKYGKTLDQIPLEDLIDIPGVMIDMYDKVHKYEDGKLNVIQNYALTREDVMEWEKINGGIPPRSLVLVRSGWGLRWPDRIQFQGGDPNANTTIPNESGKLDFETRVMNFPGFDSTAARYLAVEKQVLGVGIDTQSIDVGSSKTFPAHVLFAARGVYMIENVANIHLLPPKGFRLWAIPFKVDRGTGAPIRLLARLKDPKTHNE